MSHPGDGGVAVCWRFIGCCVAREDHMAHLSVLLLLHQAGSYTHQIHAPGNSWVHNTSMYINALFSDLLSISMMKTCKKIFG